MKRNIVLFVALYVSTFGYSQQTNLDKKSDVEPSSFVEKMPEYPGGEMALINFLSNNIEYPKKAIKKEIEGTVLAKFVICEDGSMCNLEFIKSPDKMLEKASYDVLSKMPNWEPGSNNGKNVRVYYTIPITFRLPK